MKKIPKYDSLFVKRALTLLPHSGSANFNGINSAKISKVHS